MRRRQLYTLEDDTGFLLNPAPDAAAVRSRQLAALQENSEDDNEPLPNPFPNSVSVRRRQLLLLTDSDDIGWAPGATEPSPRNLINQPRPPTPPRKNRNQEQELQHTLALQRLRSNIQSNLEAADDFLKSISAPPPLPPLPILSRPLSSVFKHTVTRCDKALHSVIRSFKASIN